METKKIAVAAVVVALSVAAVATYASRPKTYEDCVLKNIKNAHGQAAAALVSRACREQFPAKYISFEDAKAGRF